MRFQWNKKQLGLESLSDNSGFTLIEVIIGVMVLTIAIVSATSLLTSVIKTNVSNARHVQAYYLAQEGIEAVRNIRDTNWLHNLHFNANGVYPSFSTGYSYAISLRSEGWSESNSYSVKKKEDFGKFLPFLVREVGTFDSATFDVYASDFGIDKIDNLNGEFYQHSTDDEYSFYRHIDILDACDEDVVKGVPEENCKDFMLVKSTVNWENGDTGSLSLYALLSDWKGGAL